MLEGDLRDWPELPEDSALRQLYRDTMAGWTDEQLAAMRARILADIDSPPEAGCC